VTAQALTPSLGQDRMAEISCARIIMPDVAPLVLQLGHFCGVARGAACLLIDRRELGEPHDEVAGSGCCGRDDLPIRGDGR
jgi:hypothetical protein